MLSLMLWAEIWALSFPFFPLPLPLTSVLSSSSLFCCCRLLNSPAHDSAPLTNLRWCLHQLQREASVLNLEFGDSLILDSSTLFPASWNYKAAETLGLFNLTLLPRWNCLPQRTCLLLVGQVHLSLSLCFHHPLLGVPSFYI